MSELSRKEFLALLARTTAVAAAIPVVAACGGGDDDGADGPSGGDCLANGTQVSIGSNHGHQLSVSAGDVEAGVEKTYTLTDGEAHNHMVTLSANHFGDLQGGTTIMVQTTSGGATSHTHVVTVSCA